MRIGQGQSVIFEKDKHTANVLKRGGGGKKSLHIRFTVSVPSVLTPKLMMTISKGV